MKQHSERRILFIHDGPIYSDKEGRVYGIHYSNKIVDRYRVLGQHIRFLMRRQMLPVSESKDRYSQITAPDFEFIPIPDFKSLSAFFSRRKEATKIIHQAIDESDMVIIRMPSAAGGIAIDYCDQIKKPFLVEMVACTLDAYWHYSWKGKLIAHWRYYLVRKSMLKVKYCIYVSEIFLQKRYPISGKSIHCSNVALKEM